MAGSAVIRRRVTVPADGDRVWEAMTDPRLIPGWFGGEMDWSLEPGGSLSYRGEDGEVREGRVEEVRPGRHLRFVWWPAGREGAGGGEAGASEVTYLIEPTPGGTVLTVQEKPLRAAPAQPGATASIAGAGWDHWDSRLAGAWVNLSATMRTGARA